MHLTLADVVEATTGDLVHGDPSIAIAGASADSRTLEQGALFVALQGDRDGHDFVPDAFARGAAAALVSRAIDGHGPLVVVDDTLAALGALGAYARAGLSHVPVVGITGSTGKTSTKDLCAAALARTRRVHASPASFNNELGVPLTILGAPDDVDVLVLEMGARGRGHIAHLAAIARPKVGVITTIGAAHTERFGTLEEVAQAKGELFEALPGDGTAVVGDGHDWVASLKARTAARCLVVGDGPGADVVVEGLRLDSELRPSFDLRSPWGSARVQLAMRGAHQARNAAMAAAVALALGDRLDDVVAGLAEARGSRWRMELDHSAAGVTVLNDAYNANPVSAAAALDALAALPVEGRRWLVMGQMAELGDEGPDEHLRLGRRAGEVGVDRVLAVGPAASPVAVGARERGVAADEVADAEAAIAVLAAEVSPGDAVLVKGSRVAGLEAVAEALLRQGDAAEALDR